MILRALYDYYDRSQEILAPMNLSDKFNSLVRVVVVFCALKERENAFFCSFSSFAI